MGWYCQPDARWSARLHLKWLSRTQREEAALDSEAREFERKEEDCTQLQNPAAATPLLGSLSLWFLPSLQPHPHPTPHPHPHSTCVSVCVEGGRYPTPRARAQHNAQENEPAVQSVQSMTTNSTSQQLVVSVLGTL